MKVVRKKNTTKKATVGSKTQQSISHRIEPENLLSAMHIGASSVSLIIMERSENGSLNMIDYLEKSIALAHDIFKYGHILRETTEQIIQIILNYQQSIRELGVNEYELTRVMASNILSEATNHESFVNRVRIACHLRLSIIDDGQMTRLIYLKTRRRLQHLPAMTKKTTLVVHVGPGNTRVLLFQNGSISRYTSYRLGAHRTRESIEGSNAEGSTLLRMIRDQVSGNLTQLKVDYKDVTIDGVVLIGYELQSISNFLNEKKQDACSLKHFRQFISKTALISEIEAVKRFSLDYQSIEALMPALEINLAIAELFNVDQVFIPTSHYEQGLLHDFIISSEISESFGEEVLRASRLLASRYQADMKHSEHVCRLSDYFFQSLKDLHQLDEHDELLLQVAAILHEVGTYVSAKAHHKHSEYIILHSEIFGLTRNDILIVALVARYHRHSGPKMDHLNYAQLSVEDRIRVCKLASLLRVADALERTHAQRISDIQIKREPGVLRLQLPNLKDTAVEKLAMISKADLFTETFGLKIEIDDL